MKVNGVSYAGNPKDHTAMFITNKVSHLLNNLYGHVGCLLFVETGMKIPDDLLELHEFRFSGNPQREYAEFANQIAKEREERNRIRKYTLTDGGYYIGENVSIGEGAVIEPGVVIGHDVIIGKNAKLKYGVKIRDAIIGDDFTASEGAVIGTDGFTMINDEKGNKLRIESLGKVLIGNHVEIGALTSIERGTGGTTELRDYAKIDTNVLIGHDSVIGKNAEIVGGTSIGGFVSIGDNTFLGLGVSVKNRTKIGNNVIVGMGATVIKAVPDYVTVVGNPAHQLIKEK